MWLYCAKIFEKSIKINQIERISSSNIPRLFVEFLVLEFRSINFFSISIYYIDICDLLRVEIQNQRFLLVINFQDESVLLSRDRRLLTSDY